MSTTEVTISPFEIGHLTRDGEGYVYWKGQHVEHYSYTFDKLTDEALELVRRCEFLESLDIPVSSRTTIWFWPSLDGLTKDHPFYPFLKLTKELYTRGSELAWFTSYGSEPKEYPYHYTSILRIWDGSTVRDQPIMSDDFGGFYHPLRQIGFNTAQAGQDKDCGFCYATLDGVTELLTRYGWTKTTATEVI